MEKLFEHTLQQQRNSELSTKVDRLTALVEKLALGLPGPAVRQLGEPAPGQNATPLSLTTIDANTVGQVITGSSVTAVGHMNVLQITPWDSDRRINVDVAAMIAAFAENIRLKEYARLDSGDLTDPEIAPPYVTELLVDLTKRAHADPAARNVYLNPRRADQALVHLQSGKWEVLPLQEATRMLFDGVAASIHKVSRTHAELRQLPLEAQNALSLAGMVYEDEPEEYAKRAKGPMAAHLQNTAPQDQRAQVPAP